MSNKDEKLIEEIEKTKNSLKTEKLDMSFGEIIGMYEKEEIIINPEFQRLFRWSIDQRTRFIESILLGIPIPPIFVSEDESGRWELVDGLQRISTILSFFNSFDKSNNENGWTMTEGTLVSEFKGLKVEDLPFKLKLNLKRAYCRVEIIKWNSDDFDMRYELFDRLNTGGTPLTEQEIRNSIFRGKESTIFYELIDQLSSDKTFICLIEPTEKQLQEQSLKEFILRFMSLFDIENEVSNAINKHINDYMKKVLSIKSKNNNVLILKKDNESLEQRINRLKQVFFNVINILKPLGKEIFRGGGGGFSSSLFDVIMLGVANNIETYSKQTNSDNLKEKIQELKNSNDLKEASGNYSSSKGRTQRRLDLAKSFFG